MKYKTIFFMLFTIILFFGCERDDPVKPVPTDTKGVYVVNEGNFGSGNAEITLYIPETNEVIQDLYYTVNSEKLGDQAQNMYINNGVGYIVVSGSSKIVLIDVNTNKPIDTISSNLNTPRAIVFANNRMYVSNFYGSSISIFGGEDYKNFIRSVTVSAAPDEMVVLNNKIYITHQSLFSASKTVTVFDLYTEQVSRTIEVGDNPSMVKSYGNYAVILCAGDWGGDWGFRPNETFGELHFINSSTDSATDTIFVGEHPQDFAVAADYAYVLGDMGVKKVDLIQKYVSDDSFISGSFYSIAYEPVNSLLYLADPKDYRSNGEAVVYKLSASLQYKFPTGIIPGAFCFNI